MDKTQKNQGFIWSVTFHSCTGYDKMLVIGLCSYIKSMQENFITRSKTIFFYIIQNQTILMI